MVPVSAHALGPPLTHGEAVARPAVYPWRQPAGWWLKNRHYFLYMIRELTAVFAALWVVLFMLQLPKIAAGLDARAEWLNDIQSPGWVVFSLASLLFVLYHGWTFFTATGTIVYVRLGKNPTPPGLINGFMFIAWAAATIIIGAIMLWPVLG
jgi:fumarate reductase subunit C